MLCFLSLKKKQDNFCRFSTAPTKIQQTLSFPARARSMRVRSAQAVTGRRCPHSGKGEDFLTGQLNFFTETAVTSERKVKKSFPMWEINRHAEG